MSERDWADYDAERVLGDVLDRHAIRFPDGITASSDLLACTAAALRDAHARGLREGAAAERQRCAGVCDRLASQWESGEQNRPYLQGMIGAARICCDAILIDPGAGPGDMPADDRTVRQVEAERRTPGGCCDRHADQHACDCLERAKAREAAQPHGSPVTADPGEGRCGTCRYFTSSLSATSGYCRIVREGNVISAGRVAGLTQTTANLGCDIGEWRAKGE